MLQEEVYKACQSFAKRLAVYMNANLNEALRKDYPKVQEANIRINDRVEANNGTVLIQMVATEDYWYWIEYGRKKGKMPPPRVLGKEWQNKNGIDARKIIAEINVKTGKSLNINKKKLNYDSAVKQLSYLFARSIARKGIKPKPFIDKAIQEANLSKFAEELSDILKRDITLSLNKL